MLGLAYSYSERAARRLSGAVSMVTTRGLRPFDRAFRRVRWLVRRGLDVVNYATGGAPRLGFASTFVGCHSTAGLPPRLIVIGALTPLDVPTSGLQPRTMPPPSIERTDPNRIHAHTTLQGLPHALRIIARLLAAQGGRGRAGAWRLKASSGRSTEVAACSSRPKEQGRRAQGARVVTRRVASRCRALLDPSFLASDRI